MIVVRHRRNTFAELKETPPEFGIEVDVRSRGNDLINHHDAFAEGENFESWLGGYAHRLLILNVKEEGLEERLLGIMRDHGIENFFFLDQSVPFLIRSSRRGERRCAARVSEYESIENVLSLAGMIKWVWVDCFTRFILDAKAATALKEAGFKICIVSPELQGRTNPQEIIDIRQRLAADGIVADAVCTKQPESWR